LIRKGRRGRASVYIVAWVDLLGYGTQIGAAGLNPIHPDAIVAQERLRRFSDTIKAHSARFFPSIVINDGAVLYRHLSFRSSANTTEFLSKARALHGSLKAADPIGARMIVSVGFRGRGTAAKSDDLSHIAQALKKKIDLGQKTVEQALLEALLLKSSFNQAFPLNSNYAFTKSYIVDEYGSARGFGGASVFIEKAIVSNRFLTRSGPMRTFLAEIFGRTYEYLDASDWTAKKVEVNDTLSIAKYLANSDVIFHDLFGTPHHQRKII
jgi:hypothetical protein